MNYLSIDVGTTGCKCQLFSEKGEILRYLFSEYGFKEIEGRNHIDVETIWKLLKEMIKEIAGEFEINSLCISSLGESFVLLDKEDNILFYPMLYTDERGEEQAAKISKEVDENKYFSITGVLPHSMYSISKILYIKENYPNVFERADKVLLMCDYIGYLLTGERIIDYALASRTGVFDIENSKFSKELLDKFGVNIKLFSTPKLAGERVGKIREEIVSELNIKGNPVLVLGSHDQVCNSLGAGVTKCGDAVDGLGTVECITTIFDKKPTNVEMAKMGYPCVPYAVKGLYCTYILNYSCCSTVNWLRKKIMHEYGGDEGNFFTYIENQMEDGPTELLTLPYFGGASTPYQDLSATGAILGLKTETKDWQVYKSILEGTAFEMKFNAEVVKEYGINIENLIVTGGGAKSEKWLKIKSDIQGLKLKSLRSSEGGLCGCAILQALNLKGAKDIDEAKAIFVKYGDEIAPDEAISAKYEEKYNKYKKIYKMIKEIN